MQGLADTQTHHASHNSMQSTQTDHVFTDVVALVYT